MSADLLTGFPESERLDRTFPVEPLVAEVRRLRAQPWKAQRAYGGAGLHAAAEVDWTILALRSPGGDPARTDPGGAGSVPYRDTPLLAECPALAEVLQAIPAPLRAVRLMALGVGTEVKEHRDAKCGLPYGSLRLHVPVITNPGAVVVLDGVEHHWEAGRLWFGDFNRPHYVRNSGSEARVHLVVDTLVTPELLGLFPESFREALPTTEVVFAREPVRLGAGELGRLERRFTVPTEWSEWSEEEPESRAEVAAEVRVADGRLVLRVEAEGETQGETAGAPEGVYELIHLGCGEFRFEGWTEERTVQLDPDGTVRLRARLGSSLREWVRTSHGR
jgi:hypothetical protein